MKQKLMMLAIIAASTSVQAETKTLTRDSGAPVGDNQNSQTAGPNGPTLLQDTQLIEKLARFDRERIPERVVHARGTGAFGEFVSAGDFSDLTRAKLFSSKGKKTEVFVRFSTVIHPKGSPESLRDPRGFATKFYTEDGNWDLVGNNLPVFFIRDAIKFPDMVHSLKPDPKTNVQEPARYLDFFSQSPESTQMLTFLYSDLGIPASYRQMDGNGVHAFKFVNKKGQVKYVKFHWISQQGIKGLTGKEAGEMQSKDFNYLTNDLYKAIGDKNYPSWELEAQILDPSELDKFDFNPLDATKEWIRIPGLKRIKLGKMTLNKVPDNFFQTTEQAAFAPAVVPNGIEPSEDLLLQGRLFSYPDTQRHRMGGNYLMLPINSPKNDVKNHNQDGFMNFGQTKGSINYQPNSFDGGTPDRTSGMYVEKSEARLSSLPLSGATQQKMIQKTLNFKQAGDTYRAYSEAEKVNLVANIKGDFDQVKSKAIKVEVASHFYAADKDFGERVAKATGLDLAQVKKSAEVNLAKDSSTAK